MRNIFENLEPSTQCLIAAAEAAGIVVEVVNAQHNLIRLTQGKHTELVKQATFTRLDSVLGAELMTHKQLTKDILQQAGVSVPVGQSFTDAEKATAYAAAQPHELVIKPNDTNYGTGIYYATPADTRANLHEKVAAAFAHSNEVLVEEKADGKEYRFLVIDGQCIAVCERVPANVTGDGNSTIEQLVEQKNAQRRWKEYPLTLGKIELAELEKQGMKSDTVPTAEQVVWLRKNSNISTGGDSTDRTDAASEQLKQAAVHAAQAVGACICGVDLMTTDLNGGDSCIIELNWNPVLFIHDAPDSGTPRPASNAVLRALGF